MEPDCGVAEEYGKLSARVPHDGSFVIQPNLAAWIALYCTYGLAGIVIGLGLSHRVTSLAALGSASIALKICGSSAFKMRSAVSKP